MEIENLNKIRLKEGMARFFKERIHQLDPQAELYVFGSRADLTKKGGDIDLLVLSQGKIDVDKIDKIKREFWNKFGKQKLDIVNFKLDENPPFKRLALLDAVRL